MYAGQSRGLASWVVGRRGWEGTKGGFGQGVGGGRGPMVGRRSMTCEVSLTYAQTVSFTWYGEYNLHTRHGGLPAKGKEVFFYTSGLEIECLK